MLRNPGHRGSIDDRRLHKAYQGALSPTRYSGIRRSTHYRAWYRNPFGIYDDQARNSGLYEKVQRFGAWRETITRSNFQTSGRLGHNGRMHSNYCIQNNQRTEAPPDPSMVDVAALSTVSSPSCLLKYPEDYRKAPSRSCTSAVSAPRDIDRSFWRTARSGGAPTQSSSRDCISMIMAVLARPLQSVGREF